MKRAVQATRVSRRMLHEEGFRAAERLRIVALPPVPWIVRGPRGAYYMATGPRQRRITETADDFMQNTLTVVDESEGVIYLRPARVKRMLGT